MKIQSITVGNRTNTASTGGWHIEDFTLTSDEGRQGTTCEFTLHPTDSYEPLVFSEVTVESDTHARIFGGLAVSVDKIRIGIEGKAYRIRARDWSIRLSTAWTLSEKKYENHSDISILKDLFADAAGTLGGIQVVDSFVEIVAAAIPSIDLSDRSLIEALQDLADISGAQWYIDPYKNLRWFSRSLVAPVALADETDRRLNYVAQTEALSESEWIKYGVTVEENEPQRPAAAPINRVDRLVETTASGWHAIQQNITGLKAGVPHIVSAYVLGSASIGGRTRIAMRTTSVYSEFDLVAGTSPSSGTAIEDVSEVGGNPWRRISLEFTPTSSSQRVLFNILNDSGHTSYTGDTTKGLFITGVQVRQGTYIGGYRANLDSNTEVGQPMVVHSWSTDFSDAANVVTVVVQGEGDEDPTLVTVEDSGSIARYGRLEARLADTAIADEGAARLRGQVELTRRSRPQVRATVITEADGLGPGQSILIWNPNRGYRFDPLTIRSIRMESIGGVIRYTVDLGPWARRQRRLLQLLRWRNSLSADIRSKLGEVGPKGESEIRVFRRATAKPAQASGTVSSGATESVFTTTDVGATEAVYSKATAVARQAVSGGSRWTPAGGLAIGSAQLEYVQANSDGTAVASFTGSAPAVDQFAIVLRRRDLATRATPRRTSATDIDSGTAEFISGYEDVLDIAVVNPNNADLTPDRKSVVSEQPGSYQAPSGWSRDIPTGSDQLWVQEISLAGRTAISHGVYESGGTGPQGPPGMDGTDGRDGTDGTDGTDGQDGRDGTDGTDGTPGRDGTDGTPGRDGTDGAPGRDGTDGQDGAPGSPGRDGTDGQDGQDGAPGRDGEDGEDGRDGVDGQDGMDGRDGVDGQDGADGTDGEDGEDGDDGTSTRVRAIYARSATQPTLADTDGDWDGTTFTAPTVTGNLSVFDLPTSNDLVVGNYLNASPATTDNSSSTWESVFSAAGLAHDAVLDLEYNRNRSTQNSLHSWSPANAMALTNNRSFEGITQVAGAATTTWVDIFSENARSNEHVFDNVENVARSSPSWRQYRWTVNLDYSDSDELIRIENASHRWRMDFSGTGAVLSEAQRRALRIVLRKADGTWVSGGIAAFQLPSGAVDPYRLDETIFNPFLGNATNDTAYSGTLDVAIVTTDDSIDLDSTTGPRAQLSSTAAAKYYADWTGGSLSAAQLSNTRIVLRKSDNTWIGATMLTTDTTEPHELDAATQTFLRSHTGNLDIALCVVDDDLDLSAGTGPRVAIRTEATESTARWTFPTPITHGAGTLTALFVNSDGDQATIETTRDPTAAQRAELGFALRKEDGSATVVKIKTSEGVTPFDLVDAAYTFLEGYTDDLDIVVLDVSDDSDYTDTTYLNAAGDALRIEFSENIPAQLNPPVPLWLSFAVLTTNPTGRSYTPVQRVSVDVNDIEDHSLDASTVLALNSINSTVIADDAIRTPHILSRAITGEKIHANTIEGGSIQGGQIDVGHLAADALSASNIQAGTITAAVRFSSPDILSQIAGEEEEFVRLQGALLQWGDSGKISALVDNSVDDDDYVLVGKNSPTGLDAPDFEWERPAEHSAIDDDATIGTVYRYGTSTTDAPNTRAGVYVRINARQFMAITSDDEAHTGAAAGIGAASLGGYTATRSSNIEDFVELGTTRRGLYVTTDVETDSGVRTGKIQVGMYNGQPSNPGAATFLSWSINDTASFTTGAGRSSRNYSGQAAAYGTNLAVLAHISFRGNATVAGNGYSQFCRVTNATNVTTTTKPTYSAVSTVEATGAVNAWPTNTEGTLVCGISAIDWNGTERLLRLLANGSIQVNTGSWVNAGTLQWPTGWNTNFRRGVRGLAKLNTPGATASSILLLDEDQDLYYFTPESGTGNVTLNSFNLNSFAAINLCEVGGQLWTIRPNRGNRQLNVAGGSVQWTETANNSLPTTRPDTAWASARDGQWRLIKAATGQNYPGSNSTRPQNNDPLMMRTAENGNQDLVGYRGGANHWTRDGGGSHGGAAVRLVPVSAIRGD